MPLRLTTETHSYDGDIGALYRQLIQSEHEKPHLTFEQAMDQIKVWIDQSAIKEKAPLRQTHHLLATDRVHNYDPKNQIQVEELLPRVVQIVWDFDSTGIDLFLSNFGEISQLGSCPQGRTTRLLSFYIPYRT